MFVGRKEELKMLEELYNSKRFEFLVLYGRRRTGKTELLNQFSLKHPCIFFSSIDQGNELNLELFSKEIQDYFYGTFISSYKNWIEAFEAISENAKKRNEKTILIIDEFPFIAKTDKSICSILQHIIDHSYKNQNILLILCGSSISFMEDGILSEKSPLYGRTTAQYELKSFDYYESSLFFEDWSFEDRAIAYGILGGIPYYLSFFDSKISLKDNLAQYVFNQSSMLYDEPQYLLRMELRQPTVYNSILEMIACGETKLNNIKDKVHIESSKCSKYIDTLKTLRLIEKKIPCGGKETTKKTIYKIKDPFINFWYQFIFSKKRKIELQGPKVTAEEIMQPNQINDYMGHIFEDIAEQYMIRAAKKNKLPFMPFYIGRWWGSNPIRKCEDDIDVLLIDETKKKYILCECKFKNEKYDLSDYEILASRKEIFKEGKEFYYYIFSKAGFTDAVISKSQNENTKLINISELYED